MDSRVSNYVEMLEHSFEKCKEHESMPRGRLEYLSEYIFGFITYDSDISELFGERAIEVCAAINDGKTFEYVRDDRRYEWYVVMCNMPFFEGRLEWGTSIRGAWWYSRKDKPMRLSSCGVWVGEDQLLDMEFDDEEWKAFVAALVAFADNEIQSQD